MSKYPFLIGAAPREFLKQQLLSSLSLALTIHDKKCLKILCGSPFEDSFMHDGCEC
jgi:hypothetical protein